jgi:hypothetical protein
VVLVTFLADSRVRAAGRSSLWRRVGGRWQMTYHQGHTAAYVGVTLRTLMSSCPRPPQDSAYGTGAITSAPAGVRRSSGGCAV